MLTNGYKFQQAIREAETLRENVVAKLMDSLTKFETEEKPRPIDVAVEFRRLETKLADLLAGRAMYNLAVIVEAQGEKMLLAKAIRLVGGAGRLEKIWRGAAMDKMDRWDRAQARERDKDREYSQRVLSFDDSQGLSKDEGRRASALREAIAVGNGAEIELDLSPELFE